MRLSAIIGAALALAGFAPAAAWACPPTQTQGASTSGPGCGSVVQSGPVIDQGQYPMHGQVVQPINPEQFQASSPVPALPPSPYPSSDALQSELDQVESREDQLKDQIDAAKDAEDARADALELQPTHVTSIPSSCGASASTIVTPLPASSCGVRTTSISAPLPQPYTATASVPLMQPGSPSAGFYDTGSQPIGMYDTSMDASMPQAQAGVYTTSEGNQVASMQTVDTSSGTDDSASAYRFGTFPSAVHWSDREIARRYGWAYNGQEPNYGAQLAMADAQIQSTNAVASSSCSACPMPVASHTVGATDAELQTPYVSLYDRSGNLVVQNSGVIGNGDASISGLASNGINNDLDSDGIADNLDDDVDGDGILDSVDTDVDMSGITTGVPTASAQVPTMSDTDFDGIPDNADVDLDNNGVVDVLETNQVG